MGKEQLYLAALKDMCESISKYFKEYDYCPFCDNHPSHGHSEACPYMRAQKLVKEGQNGR